MSDRIPLEDRVHWLESHAAFFPSDEARQRVQQMMLHDYAEGEREDDWTLSVAGFEHEIQQLQARYMLLELQMAHGRELTGQDLGVTMAACTFAILGSLADWLGMRR